LDEDIYSVDSIRKFANQTEVEPTGEFHSVLCRVAYQLQSKIITREQAIERLKPYDYPNRLNPEINQVDFSEGPTR
jgi:hypothetical protein